MNKLIKVLYEPPPNARKWGLYKLLIDNGKGETYESYQTSFEYQVTVLKQKLFFELHVPEEIINKFEDAVRINTEIEESRSNSEDI